MNWVPLTLTERWDFFCIWAYFLIDIFREYGYNKNISSVSGQIYVLRGERNERIMC